MNRKEAIEIAERELPKPKDILNANDVPFNFGFGFNEMRFKAIPLLADKIMEIAMYKEWEKDIFSIRRAIDTPDGFTCRNAIKQGKKIFTLRRENSELQQKLDRVLGLDFKTIIDSIKYEKSASPREDSLGVNLYFTQDHKKLENILKQKIQEVVEHQN